MFLSRTPLPPFLPPDGAAQRHLVEAAARSDARAVHGLVTTYAFGTRALQMAVNRAQNAGCWEEINVLLGRLFRCVPGDEWDRSAAFGRAMEEFEAASFRRLLRAGQVSDPDPLWCCRCRSFQPADSFSAAQARLRALDPSAEVYCVRRARHSRSALGRVFRGRDDETPSYENVEEIERATAPVRVATKRRRIIIDDDDDDDTPVAIPLPPPLRRSARLAQVPRKN